MIPLRDDVPSRTVPFVNYALISINALLFLAELGMGEGLPRFFMRSAVIPALYTGHDGALGPLEIVETTLSPDLGLRILLSMFLHGGWLHFLGNMLYLWIFGDNVEDRMGHGRYLVFYLLTGWAAAYAHIWADPRSAVPSIGASGAIAGVLGAYVTLYPTARVVMLIPLGIFTDLVQVPAVFFLGIWFVQQFFSGFLSLAAPSEGGGVAWWAHIGGFAAGFAFVSLFAQKSRRPSARETWWSDDERYRRRRVRGW
ncbi:MAG TPA: rhomboid family intramembrane serine protease [Vicinamibacteria bacterium]|nr:rhomboid family intramembrane serine protease [Vicinamibacteria bacterium]